MPMPKQKFSAELKEVTGKNSGKRTDAVKWIWDYIKANDLQDPKNGRNILCDDALQDIYGKKKITMFEVGGKMLSEHLD